MNLHKDRMAVLMTVGRYVWNGFNCVLRKISIEIVLQFFSGTSNATGYAQKVICSSATGVNYTAYTNELFVKLKIPRKLAKPDSKSQILKGKISFVQSKPGDECGSVVEGSVT